MSRNEWNGGNEPVLWRLLEGLLINLLIVIAIVVAIVTYVWDALKQWFTGK